MDSCAKHNCNTCCSQADVPLLNEDIDKIRQYGYYDAYFVEEAGGVKTMRKLSGNCIFSNDLGGCEIYMNRPLRCKLLPLTYNPDTNRAEVDTGCRYHAEYKISKTMSRRMEDYIARLDHEINWRRETGLQF
jgi:Fe-S-cluster containining protein